MTKKEKQVQKVMLIKKKCQEKMKHRKHLSQVNQLMYTINQEHLYQTTKFGTSSNFRVFEDDKIEVTQMMISFFDRVENIVGKGENAGYQHFLLFPQCFQKAAFLCVCVCVCVCVCGGGGGGGSGLCGRVNSINVPCTVKVRF